MKVISIGTDRKLFEENSAVRQRQIEYGKFFDELHLVVFTPYNEKFQNQKLSDNVFLYPTKSKNRVLYIFDFFKIIREILKNSKQNDIVLSCQDPFETGIVGALLKLRFGLPLHTQVHTDFSAKYFRKMSLLNTARFFMAEFVLKYSDRVRVVSERIKNSVKQFTNNIDVLPIKTEIGADFGGEVRKPFPFTLLMVCRLEKEKNVEIVLQALNNLEDKNIGLCIVGDGSQKNSLENMAKNIGISDKVIFTGWQNNLAPYYKMADVFVSASLYEGYGLSTVEAAYFGKPLILSETGVAGDIFKENESALICDAKDGACFEKNLLKVYENKDLAEKMGRSAKTTAENLLSSENNYFKKYADSIIETADNFKKKSFISRVFDFKKTVFISIIFVRYFLCGMASVVVNIAFLYLFTDVAHIWYLYSSVLAFLIALSVSFTLQKFVVFKDKKTDGLHRQFSKFFIAAVLGVISNTILVYIFTDITGIWYILSQIIAGFFVMIQNFVLYKFFIFNK
jgi:glycosyltransferase involved in cell wall biosynthesis/putative flippase GtrA